jgi:gas vesicle protein
MTGFKVTTVVVTTRLTKKEGHSMEDDRGYPLRAVGLACVIGGLLGAVAALLLAPQSGRESRGQLRGYARRTEENLLDLADKASQVAAQAADKGHEFIKDKQAVMSEAVEAGRAAMQRARGDR